jgi:hypothetical protein
MTQFESPSSAGRMAGAIYYESRCNGSQFTSQGFHFPEQPWAVRDASLSIAMLTKALTTQITNPACVSKVMGQFASQISGLPFPGQPRAVWGSPSVVHLCQLRC